MKKSIISSSFFYFVYNILNMLFPFISSLYVARILTPDSIGKVAFAQNIVSYFATLAFLGIPTYGVREVAKYRIDNVKLSKLFSELFVINFISTIFFSLMYFGMIVIIPRFKDDLSLYALVGVTVLLNLFNVSWLYEGLEEFKYIANRNAIFKFLMLVLLIFFVKDEGNVLIYAGINIVGVAGNNLVNIFLAFKYVNFKFKDLNLKRHMYSIVLLVAVNLAIELYTFVDITMLGIFTTSEQVAFYSYGSRVNKILLQITNTITIVLVPRIALVYKEKNYKEFNRLLTKGLKVIVIFSLPMIAGIQFTVQFLFANLYGAEYTEASMIEKILCFTLIISPVGYLLGSRVMLVSGNEKKMLLSVAIGALVNIIGNLVLIPIYQGRGAAVASVISELVVMALYIFQGRKIYKLEKYKDTISKVVIATFCMTIFLKFCDELICASLKRLIIEVIGAILIYYSVLWIGKEKFVMEYTNILKKRLYSLIEMR